MTLFRSADLFCGAGGVTTGLSLALEDVFDGSVHENVEHVAVNHWDTAIETHRENHAWARHVNKDIERVRPRDVFPEGTLDLLAAAPECTHHSIARGGKPKKDQKRMQPWLILPWVQELRPSNVLIENVPEFRSWGPLTDEGARDKDRAGDTFNAFIQAIKSLGYAVAHKVLNAADYGDPTTRKRLFIIARRNHRPVFPTPTHSNEDPDLPDWRAAAEVIDWKDPGESLWTRDRPLVQNTMRRIAEGIRRYAHPGLEPFADAIADLTKTDVKKLQSTALDPEDVTESLVEKACSPFLVQVTHGGRLLDHEDPMPTVTAANRGEFALCVPYLLGQHGGSIARSVEDPAMTIAAGGAISITQPRFILPRNGRGGGLFSNPPYAPEEKPLHVVTAENGDGHLVSPYLVPFYGEREGQAPRTHDVDEPVPTVPASKAPCSVVNPYLVQYNGESTASDTEEPMPTQTGRDRFALVVPELWPWGLDLRFRMLKPRELARAMGFPDSYTFKGTKTDTVRQIGNAVCVTLARELCRTLITDETKPLVQPEAAENPTITPPEVTP